MRVRWNEADYAFVIDEVPGKSYNTREEAVTAYKNATESMVEPRIDAVPIPGKSHLEYLDLPISMILKISEKARTYGMSDSEMLTRLIESGLDEYEREQRA